MNLVFMDKRFGMNEKVRVTVDFYDSDRSPAIRLVIEGGDMSGCPHATASLCVPGAPLSNNQIVIKDYSENAGLAQMLIENGILGLVVGDAKGFPIYELTPEFAEIVEQRRTEMFGVTRKTPRSRS